MTVISKHLRVAYKSSTLNFYIINLEPLNLWTNIKNIYI